MHLKKSPVSLPRNKYGKVAEDYCSDQGATKEPISRGNEDMSK